MRKLSVLLAATVLWVTPANAIFFFVIPIPRGNVNPNSVDATLDQRRNSMCAALHKIGIDPELSGKLEDSWHGEIMSLTAQNMSQFPNYKKLTGIYIRQWQLQTKQNFQAGERYSRMLQDSCNKISLPFNKSQYDNWVIIKRVAPNATDIENLRIEASPLDLGSWFLGETLPRVTNLKTVKNTVATVQVNATGMVTNCEIDQSSTNAELDAAACPVIFSKGRFSPEIDGFRIIGSTHDLTINWLEIYSASGVGVPAKKSAGGISGNDPILNMAINRCLKMGHSEGQNAYKQCLNTQLNLLSK